MMRFAVLLLAIEGVLSASVMYTVVGLGSLEGTESVAYAVNASGEAAGWATAGVDPQALAFTAMGSPTNLTSAAHATDATASGINNAGWIAGTAYSGGISYGVVWTPGGVINLGAGTYAAAVNNAGQVAGNGTTAFLYSNGSRTDIGALGGGSWSVAEGLNQSGEVTGYGNTASGIEAFVWASGAMTGLGTLGGADSYAFAVNDAGEVVGSAETAAGYLNAFAWSGGAMRDLGTLGGSQSYAYGVNDSGVAVGYSWLAGNTETDAWVLLNGVMTDLNSLLPPGSGWDLTAAYGINNEGQIVGSGTFDGQQEAFLLDPISSGLSSVATIAGVPEPASWELLALGALLLASPGGIRRRKV